MNKSLTPIRALMTVALLASLVTLVAPSTVRAADAGPWPARRFAPCGAFDAERSTLYAVGGRGEGGQTHYNDAWALRVAAGARPAWRQLATPQAAAAPPPVRSCAAALDPTGNRLLVFAGWDGVTMQNSVWSLDVSSGAWSVLCSATSCGAGPSPRRASQMVYDAARNRMIMFGGLDSAYRNDVWALSLGAAPAWSPIGPTGDQPAARGGHSMVADTARDRVWLFGGTRTGSDLSDTWSLDLAANEWHQESPTCAASCPSARSGATLVHDTTADRLVLYGGWESAPNRYPEQAWTLSELDGVGKWTPVDVDSERPQPRFFHLAGFDPAGQRMIVFGGGSGSNAYKDSHALLLGGEAPVWRGVQPTTALTARDQVAVTFDADSRRLTVFGGFGSGVFPGSPDAGAHLADTFQLPLGAGGRLQQWRNVTPLDQSTVPIAREATAYASDAANHRLYLVGGLTGDIELNDVWVVDGTDTSRPAWRQLCSPTSCGAAPAPRWGGHALFDAVGQRLVVFGGRSKGGVTLNDTWVLDVHGSPQWRELRPTGPVPPSRWGGAIALAQDGRMLLFGGQTGPDGSGVTLGDTWALSLEGDGAWTELRADGPSPSPRRSPAYAAAGGVGTDVEMMIFGGLSTESGAHHNDVWTLRVNDDQALWKQPIGDLCSEKKAPMCRRSASAVFDAPRNELVIMFGRDSDRFVDDVWRFDIANSLWRTLADERQCS